MRQLRINKKAIMYNSMVLTASSIVMQFLVLIYRAILSRFAGSEGMGVYQLIMPVYSVLMSCSLSGITMAVSRLSAQRHALNDAYGVRRLVRTAILVFLTLFCLIALPFVSLSDWVATSLLGDSRTRTALLLLLPCLLLTGMENIFKSCFYGAKSVYAPIVSETIEQILRIAAVVALMIILKPQNPGAAAAIIVLAMIVSEIFSSTFMYTLYRKNMAKHKKNRQKNEPLLEKLLTIAMPLALSGLVNQILNAANSILIPKRLMMSGLSASQALSEYGVVFGMTIPLLSMPGAFIFPLNTVLVPTLSEEVALQNTADIKRKAAKAIHVTSLIGCPAIAFLILFGPMIAQLMYREPSSGAYLTPLALAILMNFYQIIANSILNGIGKQTLSSGIVVICGVLQLLFTWFCVPLWGIRGYVVGSLVCSLFGMLAALYYAVKHCALKVRFHNWFVIPALSAALAMLCARPVFAYLQRIGSPAVLALICAGVTSAAIYAMLLRLQGVDFIAYIKSIMKIR